MLKHRCYEFFALKGDHDSHYLALITTDQGGEPYDIESTYLYVPFDWTDNLRNYLIHVVMNKRTYTYHKILHRS